MKSLLISGLAAGAITVLICTSSISKCLRDRIGALHPKLHELINCCFCTSWWISLAMLNEFTLTQWAATVAIANITILLIHMSIATIGDEDELDQELVRAEELQQSMEESDPDEIQRRCYYGRRVSKMYQCVPERAETSKEST